MQDAATLEIKVPIARGADAAPDSLLSGSRRQTTVGLVLLVTLIAFEGLAVATAMPVVRDDLGGTGLYGFVFAAFTLASLGGILFAGRQADQGGAGRTFAQALILFGAGLLVSGTASTMVIVLAGRALQGFAAGALGTLAYVAIARQYDESLRPRMFAVLSSAWVIPGIIGPAAAGAVAETVGWRMVFLGLLPLLPVVAILNVPAFRRLAATERATENASPLAGLRVSPAVLVLALASLAFFGSEAFLPLTLNEVRGQAPAVAGLALTAATLTWTAGSWLQARKDGQWTRRAIATSGLGLIAAGIAVTAATLAGETPPAAAVLGWGIAGLGMGLTYTSSTLSILAEATDGAEGGASASIQVANMAGITVGTSLGGAVLAAGSAVGGGASAGLAVIFPAMAAFALLAVVAARRLPLRPSTAS